MKLILSLAVVAVVMGLAVQHRDSFTGEVLRYEKATPEVVTQEELVIDPIDKARQELERINTELDQAETVQLEARKAAIATYEQTLADLKAKHEADLAAYDAELDRIRSTRVDFQ